MSLKTQPYGFPQSFGGSGGGTSGYSGYSGLSGYSGYSGTSGFSGYSGYSGRSGYSGYSGTPAGSNTYVQYNDSSAFGGDSGLTWDKTAKTLTVTSSNTQCQIVNGTNASGSRIYINSTAASPNVGFELQENGVNKWAIASYNGGTFTFYNDGAGAEAMSITADNVSMFLRCNVNTTGANAGFVMFSRDSLNARWQWYCPTNNDLRLYNHSTPGDVVKINAAGDFIFLTASKGPILKDTNGHYWRITVSTSGVLTTSDLGTSIP